MKHAFKKSHSSVHDKKNFYCWNLLYVTLIFPDGNESRIGQVVKDKYDIIYEYAVA